MTRKREILELLTADELRALVDRLEDQRIRSHPRVRKSLAQMHRGEYEPFASADL